MAVNLHVAKDLSIKDRQAYQELCQKVRSLLVSESHTVATLLSAVIAVGADDALERMALIADEAGSIDSSEIIAACLQGPLELPPTAIG